MARNQSDPILNAAHIVSKNMGSTAFTYREKAHNDKTYVVTILGVNQDFTDDISENEQNNIKEKFKIPSVVSGNANHYTFKIDGNYYCKQQNGNFKLYDTALLRIPNNNWDAMFLERIGISDEDTDGSRNIYVDIYPPPAPKYIASNLYQTFYTYVFWLVVGEHDGKVVVDAMYEQVSRDYESPLWSPVAFVSSDGIPVIDKEIVKNSNHYYWIKPTGGQDIFSVVNKIYICNKVYDDDGNLNYVWSETEIWKKGGEQQDGMQESLPERIQGYEEQDSTSIKGYPIAYIGMCCREGEIKGSKNYIYVSNQHPPQNKDLWIEVSNLKNNNLCNIYEYVENDNFELSESGCFNVWNCKARFNRIQQIHSLRDAGQYGLDIWIVYRNRSLGTRGISAIFMHTLYDDISSPNWVVFTPRYKWWDFMSDEPAGYVPLKAGDSKINNYKIIVHEESAYICDVNTGKPRDPLAEYFYIDYDEDGKICRIEFRYPYREIPPAFYPFKSGVIYPETTLIDDEQGMPVKVTLFENTVIPEDDGLVWCKIDSSIQKNIMSESQTVHNSWQLLYNVPDNDKDMIVYTTQPEKIAEPKQNDYYVYYQEEYDEHEDKIIKTFAGLFIYENRWVEIKNVTSGTDEPPQSANKDEYYVCHDENFGTATIYKYMGSETEDEDEESDEESAWEEVTVSDIYFRPYQPVKDEDYWVKINSIKAKKMLQMHQFINNKWVLLYNSYTPKIYSDVTDPSTRMDEQGKLLYKVEVGDYWAQIDSYDTQNLIAFYERVSVVYNDIPRETWQLLYHGGKSGTSLIVNVSNAILVEVDKGEEI